MTKKKQRPNWKIRIDIKDIKHIIKIIYMYIIGVINFIYEQYYEENSRFRTCLKYIIPALITWTVIGVLVFIVLFSSPTHISKDPNISSSIMASLLRG